MNAAGTSSDRTPAPLHTILVVTDDEMVAGETKQWLTEAGHKVSAARDGGQVYGSLQMMNPDLVLLDVILPGESGFEICEKIKQQHNRVPILIYSDVDLDSARNLADRVGADGYLARPCDSDELFDMMRRVAEAVWERIEQKDKSSGVIRFRCSCGQRMREKFENRGKYISCPSCQTRLAIPNQGIHEFIVHTRDKQDDSANGTLQPLRFVTVKCSHCLTFYRLSSVKGDWRQCPSCGQMQTGSLSIVGAPMSRAALESSLRVLRVLTGKSKGKKLMLPERSIVFGRDDDCDIRHGSQSVGGKHCRLTPVGGGIQVEDLGSGSGTFINGNRVEGKALLGAGQVLRLGELQFRLIGQDLSVEEEMQRVQKWSEQEKAARERGIRLIDAGKETAAEAAQVIQQHWNITRRRHLAAVGMDSSDGGA